MTRENTARHAGVGVEQASEKWENKTARRGWNPPPDLTATPSLEGALALAERTPATSVYRYYDRHGLLVYVGITDRGIRRNREHNARAVWWPFVVRQEVDHFATRHEAEAQEKALIAQYRPPFNTRHNPDAENLRRIYLAFAESADGPEETARQLLKRLDKWLPLIPIEQGDRYVVFRTEPDHHPVASRLEMNPRGVNVTGCGSRRGEVETITQLGLFTVVRLVGWRTERVWSGVAHVKFASQRGPVFRIGAITLSPESGGERE